MQHILIESQVLAMNW